eukprot:14457408-Alexandrium_andersonii.AAC.1
MSASLVRSEMCIRDRCNDVHMPTLPTATTVEQSLEAPLAKMQPPSKAKTFSLLKTPASSPKNLGFDAGARANPNGAPAPSTATQKHLL